MLRLLPSASPGKTSILSAPFPDSWIFSTHGIVHSRVTADPGGFSVAYLRTTSCAAAGPAANRVARQRARDRRMEASGIFSNAIGPPGEGHRAHGQHCED